MKTENVPSVVSQSSIFIIGIAIALFISNIAAEARSEEEQLFVGWASVDITPEKPVALVGQHGKRISQSVLDPLTATVLALETRGDDGKKEQAIMVSCDVLSTKKAVQTELREIIKPRLPGFDTDKLFMNATHTHTGPGFIDGAFKGRYDVSGDEGVMKASEYAEFFVKRVSKAVIEAWENREPGGMSWALGHAVVGLNRRAQYFDGTAKMYGDTSREDFARIEGYEDHGVEMLFFWGPDNEVTGVVINLACPSQETEGLSDISADFWHDTREEIRKRFSNEIHVFPQCSASGDLSPHRMFRQKAEDMMRERRGLCWRQEIARRIADTVEDVLPLAKQDVQTSVVFKHDVARIDLPRHEPFNPPFYEMDSITPIEFHVMRLVSCPRNTFAKSFDLRKNRICGCCPYKRMTF